MQFMALIYDRPESAPAFGTPEFGAFLAAYQAARERYAKDGVLVAGEALDPASAAVTLRVRDGTNETLDGPFAESKEQLGGFFIFDCESLEKALEYAALIPSAKTGAVEVRPIRSYRG